MSNSEIDKAETVNKHHHSVLCKQKSDIALLDGVSPIESIPSLSIDVCGV